MSQELFESLSSLFSMDIGKAKPGETCIVWRVHLKDPEHADKFINAYGEAENNDYVVYDQNCHPQRYITNKTWICHRSKKCKTKTSRRNVNCMVKINILIKKVNKATAKNDALLKRKPPLNAVIKIQSVHTHDLLSAENLKMLRVLPETKAMFEGYFNIGMTVAQARRYHEENLRSKENYPLLLANTSKNPSVTQASHLFSLWKNGLVLKPRPIETPATVAPKIETYIDSLTSEGPLQIVVDSTDCKGDFYELAEQDVWTELGDNDAENEDNEGLDRDFLLKSLLLITETLDGIAARDPDTERSAKAKRGVLDAISCYKHFLNNRKRKPRITLEDYMAKKANFSIKREPL